MTKLLTNKHRVTIFALLSVWSISSFAVNDVLVGHLNPMSNDLSSKDTISGYIGGLSNQARTDVGDVPGNRYNGHFEFDYNKKPIDPTVQGIESRFHMAALYNDENLAMYSLQEAYVGGNFTSKDRVVIGRQILPWSDVDAIWGFGKLNNRRNFDYFQPGQEGLIGLQYERKSSNGMRYRIFGSGLYAPELNPSLDIDKNDKTITSRHPWADVPATSAEVEGNDRPIHYNVDYPSLSEVIYRYTIGANIGYQNDHWDFNNFIIRKPENQLSTQVEVSYDSIQSVVDARITPQFYYHDVYGSSLKYKNNDIEMYVSGIAVRPNTFPDGNEDVLKYTEIKTEKRREDYLGGGFSKTNDLYSLGMNYVARLSPFDRIKEEFVVDPRWNQALNVFATRNFGKSYTLVGDVKYDMLTTDRLAMVKAIYRATKQLQLSLGINMIGTPTSGKSYWSPYTNNDQVYGALRYFF